MTHWFRRTQLPMSSLRAVSYTHLDVYKRQVLSLISDMLKAIAEYAKHDRAEFVRVVQKAQSSQQTTEAVSYTHLDVYKRQC